MPIFTYVAVVGSVLIALLFVVNPMLEKGTRAVVTSDRVGLPARWRYDTGQTLTPAPAPPPDMTSQAILAAQPKSELGALEKIEPAARAARAEAPPKTNHIRRPAASPQNRLFDRFSIQGQ